MLKTRIKMAQDYTVFNYRPPILQYNIKSQDKMLVEGTGTNLAPNVLLPGNSKEKVAKEIPPYALLMEYLETSLAITVYKACGNTGRDIVQKFIKPILSKKIHLVYYLDGPGPSIAI